MRPVVLTILDGWGHSSRKIGNAIANAKTPNLDAIFQKYPSTLLQASGEAVGMTWGESGNSEVGHLTIGSGRTIFQYLTRINKSIQEGKFFELPGLVEAANHARNNNGNLHLVGLLTSNSVHAYLDHLFALLKFAKTNNLKPKIHLFLDGRDSGLKEGVELIQKALTKISEIGPPAGGGEIVSLIGRDFAMDRNNDWGKTETAYRLLTEGRGETGTDPVTAVSTHYAKDINDPDIPPIIINPQGIIQKGDAVVFFNFREDSMRQLIRVFVDQKFDIFQRNLPSDLYICSMTQYLESPDLHVLFAPPAVPNSLPEIISNAGLKQFHIAETEKYAHVTYFFNGLRNNPFDGETDVFIESIHDPLAHSEMRAPDIVQKTIEELNRDFYKFFVLNLANGDILSHLGDLNAAIKSVEAIDAIIGTLEEAVLSKDGILAITSDHGNAEALIYYGTGEHETKHNENPVPFYLIAKEYERKELQAQDEDGFSNPKGIISDVAPTILEIMGIEKPVEMTGESLLKLIQ